jgi:anti-anti-sigma factor
LETGAGTDLAIFWAFSMTPRESVPKQVDVRANGVRLFFSYSHRDSAFRRQLDNHLAMLKRERIVSTWNDRMVNPGDEWRASIDDAINSADIICLLVSADFLASDYCYEVELQRALERHRNREARVVPIIIRPADWHTTPFADLQALPRDARPVALWPNRDQAYSDIAAGIRMIAQSIIYEIRRGLISVREASGISVVDVRIPLTLNLESTEHLREVVYNLLRNGRPFIVLNLRECSYLDSAGMGELVTCYSEAVKHGGMIRLLNLSQRVEDLLRLTKLFAVFDSFDDEETAINSFPTRH